MKANNIIAITISTNYEDLLPYIVEANAKFFKHWYIVTEESDKATQEICSKYPNIETLFFSFKTPQCAFNFGGARRFAQQIAQEKFKEDFILILDSDICLPENFKQVIDSSNLEEEIIYGATRRLVYDLKDYINNNNKHCIIDKRWVNENRVIGFFQLYKSSNLYKDSYSCAETDEQFARQFASCKFLDLIVDHIGVPGQDWCGRKSKKQTL